MTAWVGPPLVGHRLVVVAPHPDDEVLGTGGLMRWTAASGRDVVVVAVTDGEASHSRSARVTGLQLRRRRAEERAEALARLDVPATVISLGLPDQGCTRRREDLVAELTDLLRSGDIIVGPAVGDRHPDHVAVASAISEAAPSVVDQWWEAPTWALVHGTAAPASSTLILDERAWWAKQHAMAAYRSQLVPLGPEPQDGPVVHPDELVAMLRRNEEFASVTERARTGREAGPASRTTGRADDGQDTSSRPPQGVER